MARFLDISPPLSEEIAVWPGDEPYRREMSLDMRGGDHMTLSSIRTTGKEVASGVYLYRLQTKQFVQVKKLALLR